jgi:hypothetical protein
MSGLNRVRAALETPVPEQCGTLYFVRKIGTDEYWDGQRFGELSRAEMFRTIAEALAARCGAVLTDVVDVLH